MTKANETDSLTPPSYEDVAFVWNDNPNDQYRRDQSHWRDQGRWDPDTWAAIGRSSLASIRSAASMLGRPVPAGPLLEWGPGGGSNLLAFAGTSSMLYGVDIAPSNLAEAGRVLAELDSPPPFVPIVVGADPTAVADEIAEPVDIFVSTAVFQHFPSREYGADVLRTVARALSPHAIGLIQIRYDNGSPRYAPKKADYKRQHITFTSYPLEEFWDLLVVAGLRPLAITDIRSSHNYATFTFVPA